MRLPPVLAAALVAVSLAAVRDARADGAADLEKAHNAYVAHQYDEAESRLRALLDPLTGSLKDPDSVADARMYLGATLVAEKKPDEAATVFATLLSDKPDYQPDALRVSLDAIDAFTDARAKNRDKLAAIQADRVRKAQDDKARAEAERQRQVARLAMLEKLASTEVVTTQNSRLIALIPFGAGQFQNGQTGLAWTLLVSEGLLAVGSGIGAAVSYYNIGQRDGGLLGEPGFRGRGAVQPARADRRHRGGPVRGRLLPRRARGGHPRRGDVRAGGDHGAEARGAVDDARADRGAGGGWGVKLGGRSEGGRFPRSSSARAVARVPIPGPSPIGMEEGVSAVGAVAASTRDWVRQRSRRQCHDREEAVSVTG